MLVLNSAPTKVFAQHGGATYAFNPGERKEILDVYAGRHIVQRWEKYGLVDITWDEKLATQYTDHELYVHEKRKTGLMNVYERLLEQSQNFQNYDQECGEKKTVERLRFGQKAKAVLGEIKAVEGLMQQVEALDPRSLLKSKADKIREQAAAMLKEANRIDGDNLSKSESKRSN